MIGRKHLLRWPSFGKASAKSVMSDAKSSSPLSKAVRFSVVGKHPRFTGILRLFQLRGPSAIVFFVVAVAILPVDCSFSKRLRSHVLKEVDERIKPSLTYCDPTTAVDFIVRSFWVVASSLHLLPRRVFRRFLSSATCAFRVCAMAAARNCAFLSEVRPGNDSCVAALALTQPVSQFVSNFGKMDHSQLAINISRLVFDAGRQLDRITRRHDLTPDKLDCDRAESVHNDCLGSFYFIRM